MYVPERRRNWQATFAVPCPKNDWWALQWPTFTRHVLVSKPSMGETLGNVISGYFRQTSTNLATGKKAGVPHGLKPRRPRRPLSNIYFILFHAFCFCWIISTHGEGDRITTTAAKGEGIQQYLRSTELRVLDVNWEPETRRRRCHLASLYSHRVLKRKSRLRPPLWNDYLFVTSVSRFSAHILLIIPAGNSTAPGDSLK